MFSGKQCATQEKLHRSTVRIQILQSVIPNEIAFEYAANKTIPNDADAHHHFPILQWFSGSARHLPKQQPFRSLHLKPPLRLCSQALQILKRPLTSNKVSCLRAITGSTNPCESSKTPKRRKDSSSIRRGLCGEVVSESGDTYSMFIGIMC